MRSMMVAVVIWLGLSRVLHMPGHPSIITTCKSASNPLHWVSAHLHILLPPIRTTVLKGTKRKSGSEPNKSPTCYLHCPPPYSIRKSALTTRTLTPVRYLTQACKSAFQSTQQYQQRHPQPQCKYSFNPPPPDTYTESPVAHPRKRSTKDETMTF